MIEAPQPAAPVSEKMSFIDAVTRDVQKHFPLFQYVGKKGKLDGKLVVAFEENADRELRAVFFKSASAAVALEAEFGMYERMRKLWDVTAWYGEEDEHILVAIIVNRLHCRDSLAASSTG